MNPTPKDRIEFERTNVLGSERLARSAAESGVKRFVYLSSIKVNGEHTAARAFRADDVPHPQDDYARSKLEAERRLADIGASSDMAVAVVRPPLVYGAGVRANFLRLLSLAHSGLPLPLASIANVRSMVSVWNLCDLIRALLQHGQPMTGVFLAGDGEDVSTAELVRRLAKIMNRRSRLFAMPIGALRILAALAGRRAELSRLCESLAWIYRTPARGWHGRPHCRSMPDCGEPYRGICSVRRSSRPHESAENPLDRGGAADFMKIAPLYHALSGERWCRAMIVHTGQHYDYNMSASFFRDLKLPEPDFHLEVGSGSHAEQTGRVMIEYEKIAESGRPTGSSWRAT